MANRFQHIPDSHFQPNQSFIVRESKGINALFGFGCLGLAVIIFSESALIAVVIGLVAVIAFATAGRSTKVMEVGPLGFFYYGRLITDWQHFVSARFWDGALLDNESSSEFSDRFYLVLRYYKPDGSGCFERRFRFTNSQDKSEEEVMAAIRFYYKNRPEAA